MVLIIFKKMFKNLGRPWYQEACELPVYGVVKENKCKITTVIYEYFLFDRFCAKGLTWITSFYSPNHPQSTHSDVGTDVLMSLFRLHTRNLGLERISDILKVRVQKFIEWNWTQGEWFQFSHPKPPSDRAARSPCLLSSLLQPVPSLPLKTGYDERGNRRITCVADQVSPPLSQGRLEQLLAPIMRGMPHGDMGTSSPNPYSSP